MGASLLTELLRPVVTPITNRDATQLTTLMMTGVTAMSRGTAAAMARNGVLYPAAIISATLAAADITHISNEIPFLDDCVVNNTLNNLILCSHTDYWATLEAVGTDIVGLSGNHVNDFGREGARRSLQFYKDNNIPIYGSGLTIEEACAPLQWEHNGNSFAFFAFLAFGPESAWVTETEPGACYYYDRKEELLTAVREAAKTVDIVAVELQYEETYFPYPTANQVIEFRELREAGAAVVTGVQSHVPQAMEPYGANDAGGPGVIVYGLGNLFFDQMWSWETRTELYARHTIYGGRVISTEILTGVLEDFAQPRWATPEERAGILSSIFTAAPPRP
jgi:poly-gamma-glutamate synthesis protein (capsule biosynthesis protein)